MNGAWEIVDEPGFGVPPPLSSIPPFLKEWFINLPDETQRLIEKAAVLLCAQIFYDQFHYPQPQPYGVPYRIDNNPFEKVKWVYRYWFNQLEVAEIGSGLEKFFKNESIVFELVNWINVEGSVSISCAGDLLAVDVLTPENTPHLFDGIADFYGDADLVCANLESTVYSEAPIGRNQVTGEPARMNTSQAMFDKFRNEGKINYFSTATNHAFDYGEAGLLATIDVIEQSNAWYSGTNKSAQVQDDVLVIEQNGIKIAMLAFTMDINGFQWDEENGFKDYMVNIVPFNDRPCDISMVEKQVARAKEKGAEFIIAYCHWGWEFEMYPHNAIVEVAKRVMDAGVNVILGNHPHVSQPMQSYFRGFSSWMSKGLIVYGYGDFVSYHPESRNSKIAYITKLNIKKGKYVSGGELEGETRGIVTDGILIDKLEFLPVYILNEKLPGELNPDGSQKYDCRILKFKEVYENPDKYGLTDLEKSQLPHLNDVVLKDILLPQNYKGILV